MQEYPAAAFALTGHSQREDRDGGAERTAPPATIPATKEFSASSYAGAAENAACNAVIPLF